MNAYNTSIFKDIINVNVHSLGGQYSSYISAGLILLAIIFIYYGYKAHLNIIRVMGFVYGFALGAVLALAYIGNDSVLNLSENVSQLAIFIGTGTVFGLIGAALSLFVLYVTVFLSGALMCSFMSYMFMDFNPTNFNKEEILILIITAIIGGTSALFLYKVMYVIMTSFIGSQTMIAVITGASFYNVLNQYKSYWLVKPYALFWFFFLSGIVVQLGTMKLIYKEKLIVRESKESTKNEDELTNQDNHY